MKHHLAIKAKGDKMGKEEMTTTHVNTVMNDKVADQKKIVNQDEIKRQFETKETLKYIKNDSYNADPKLLLGQVFLQKVDSEELVPFLIAVESKPIASSVLQNPLVRAEMIIDSKAGAALEIMSYLSLSLKDNEIFEFRVVDNMGARLENKGDEWINAIMKWVSIPMCRTVLQDKTVKNIGVVTGIVQKCISTKKYKKFDVSTKGGAFGVNVSGELYTSSSEYALDIVYGLDLVYIPKQPESDLNEFVRVATTGSFISDAKTIMEVGTAFDRMVKNNKFPNLRK